MLEIHELDGQRGLRLVGELDMQSAQLLVEALASMPLQGPARLDLTELTFIDSSGLHVIAHFADTQNGNGPLIVQGVSAMLMRVFEITKLTDHPSLEIRPLTDGD